MKIIATPLVVGAGVALASDDQSINVMLRPGEVHTVSDVMRSARSIRHAITLGYIQVVMDGGISDDYLGDHSDFVAQVELNAVQDDVNTLASMVSGFSGSFGVPGTKFIFLDIHGGADTAEIRKINGTPYLIFRHDYTDRTSWTVTIPDDYIVGTPLYVEVYWSPSNSTAGNVKWILEYKSVTPGAAVGLPSMTSTLIQPSPGTADLLTTTGTSLVVPAGVILPNALLSVQVQREGKNDPADTYVGQARVHLVRLSYTGKKFSP